MVCPSAEPTSIIFLHAHPENSDETTINTTINDRFVIGDVRTRDLLESLGDSIVELPVSGLVHHSILLPARFFLKSPERLSAFFPIGQAHEVADIIRRLPAR